MRATLLCLAAGVALLAACSKTPAGAPAAAPADAAAQPNAAGAAPAPTPAAAAPASGPALAGVFTGQGKPAALTEVVAYKGDPDSSPPVTVLVFSTKDQAGDAKPAFDALFGKFGDALVVKVSADGKVQSVDVIHSAMDFPGGSAQLFGVVSLEGFSTAGGQISGHLTSGGPVDIHGQKVVIDLTFHTKAP
jgi:hypothetical protein